MVVQVPLVVRLNSLHYRYRKVALPAGRATLHDIRALAGKRETLEDQFGRELRDAGGDR